MSGLLSETFRYGRAAKRLVECEQRLETAIRALHRARCFGELKSVAVTLLTVRVLKRRAITKHKELEAELHAVALNERRSQ